LFKSSTPIKAFPKKQRHTAKCIYERIKEEGYQGKYTQVKEAVRENRHIKREVFMPLIQQPGEAQIDFGYALARVSMDFCRSHNDKYMPFLAVQLGVICA
jgi:hypothetical protein